MHTKITYVGTLNGIHGIWCGFLPEGVVVEEERTVLYPEQGYVLKKEGNTFSAVWLHNGDVQENYRQEKEVINAD